MLEWYYFVIGVPLLFLAAIGIEWFIDFWFSWPFEE